ncbi:MAG: AbrB/MazE/SpoVT family DNA-binding domain-containing protein [Candidatus Micrarchaeota archaeon]|nr:AbrB/MazE/SpoVT family DNA-binding domain-containing protein [Candidatus Micrarchaeota archaeon]
MNVLETIKVSSRGQIVIPEGVRNDLDIKEGCKLILIEDNGKIVLEKEAEFLKKLKDQQEKAGWLAVAEKSLEKVWNNKKDDKIWAKY